MRILNEILTSLCHT